MKNIRERNIAENGMGAGKVMFIKRMKEQDDKKKLQIHV